MPDALRGFVALFNDERYWESHELLEGPWRGNGSEFYHGLILLASVFVHVQRGNAHGVRAQAVKARRALEGYRPAYLGIDVDRVLEEAKAWSALTEHEAPETWAGRRRLPQLTLLEGLIRGDEVELGDG